MVGLDMSEKFADIIRQDCDSLWKQIYNHPFILELETGKLPFENYKMYIIQNDYYQKEFNRCLALAAARSRDYATLTTFAKILAGGIEENEKLLDFALKIGISKEDLNDVKPHSDNIAYISFMYRICAIGSTAEVAASLIPCAWTYMELGGRIRNALKKNYKVSDDALKLYDGYSSPEMLEFVQMFKDLISDNVNPQDIKMHQSVKEIFTISSEFEYKFWGIALNQ